MPLLHVFTHRVIVRRIVLLFGLMLIGLTSGTSSVFAESFKWIAPSPAELSMTSDPKAPGAPAIILSYEEVGDGESAELLVHVRIKVLTEAGRSVGDVEAPATLVSNDEFNKDFYARTIHPDGTIIPYVASNSNSHVVTLNQTAITKVSALPDVTVGSIIEYGYHFASQNTPFQHLIGYYDPTWLIQRKYFVRAAHFTLKIPARLVPGSTRWLATLPPGAEIKQSKTRVDLDVYDVPAQPDEEFMPPRTSLIYNVRFFYYSHSRDRFWGEIGADQDNDWLDFYSPRKTIKDAVKAIIQPSDTSELKLHKLYDALQLFENTDLTRARSIREDKQNGLSPAKNSEDVWTRKRGNSDEITLLFIALARAAGFQAYPMAVASRDQAIFSQDMLSWSQLDSMLAIVIVDGKERFFDPGTRRCAFGTLAPWHANVIGVSTEAKLVKIRATPSQPSSASRTDRVADLTVDPAGSITGSIAVSYNGNAGLSLRRKSISDDPQSVRTSIEHDLQAALPAGVEIKLISLDALEDPEVPLVAKFSVSGHLGTATQKRLILPAEFFASADKPILAAATRVEPVAFPSPYVTRDLMVLHLDPSLKTDTMPAAQSISLGTTAGSYTVRIQPPTTDQADPKVKPFLVTQRTLVLNHIDYKPEEYGPLHTYFNRVATADQDQIVLLTTGAPTGGN